MPRGRKKGEGGDSSTPKKLTINAACVRQARVEEAAHWNRRGMSDISIAQAMKIDPGEVKSLLKSATLQYKQSLVYDRASAVGEKLAQLQDIYREAYAEWERSKLPSDKVVVEELPVEDCALCDGSGKRDERRVGKRVIPGGPCSACQGKGKLGGVTKVVKTTEGRLADPAYLSILLKTIESVRELLGFDEPRRTENKNTNTNEHWNVLVSLSNGPPQDKVEPKLVEMLEESKAKVGPRLHTNGETNGHSEEQP